MSNNYFKNNFELQQKVVDKFKSGLTAKQIAKEVNISSTTIVNYAKKIGIWDDVKQKTNKGGINLLTDDLRKFISKGQDGRFYKKCPRCGVMQSYLRVVYAIESYKLKKVCKSCSNKETDNNHRGMHREIRISWFNKFKLSAANRKYSWNLSIDDIADLYHVQKKKCALTGWDISSPEETHINEIPMSIDEYLMNILSKLVNIHEYCVVLINIEQYL